MANKQDRRDDIHTMSQQFKSINTAEPNLNANEHHPTDPTKSQFKSSTSMNFPSDKKELASWEKQYLDNLPSKNLPEKILLVVDTVEEPNFTPFETKGGDKFAPLTMIKRVLEIFVTAKSAIQPKHEYALMALGSNDVAWIGDFTSERRAFVASLEKIKAEPILETSETYDLGPCFEAIASKLDILEKSSEHNFVSRIILIYSRSKSVPLLPSQNDYFSRLIKYSHLYFDCLYVHEPPNSDNLCQEAYKQLSDLDVHQTSYILEVGRNLATLHTNMAKLIAHPLQRARQDNIPYTVYNLPSCQESQKKACKMVSDER